MKIVPAEFAEILKHHGRPLADVGANESALQREWALAAIDALEGSPIAIVGGDVWRLVGRQPEPAYANWHSDRRAGESAEDYCKRSWQESRGYISRYPDPEDGATLYTLVIDDR